MSAFDDYLAQLRRLDGARRSADEAAARTATAAESLGQRTARLTETARDARAAVDALARAARVPAPRPGPQPPAGADPRADLDAAEADLGDARAAYDEARYLAHRPPWLPRWRADERNGLVYGVCALGAVLVHLMLMRAWKGLPADVEGNQSSLTLALFIGLGVLAPLLAFVIGWFAVGFASRPPIAREDKRIERHWQLGLVVTLSTLLVPIIGMFA
ncbi:hypothetical protein [Glycomyces paridis]|uniref:Uncharacterized protein n=1 Tax=Glycomyces paridis TaxID=2126555 RepID=A0A4S8PHM5_9ACTN|nr:hypothetical protein [Glycomyces paridis]THV30080.1 hypothetical protein E9998_06800 [Glycomyces paridis]